MVFVSLGVVLTIFLVRYFGAPRRLFSSSSGASTSESSEKPSEKDSDIMSSQLPRVGRLHWYPTFGPLKSSTYAAPPEPQYRAPAMAFRSAAQQAAIRRPDNNHRMPQYVAEPLHRRPDIPTIVRTVALIVSVSLVLIVLLMLYVLLLLYEMCWCYM